MFKLRNILSVFVSLMIHCQLFAQDLQVIEYKTDIYEISYSQLYQQPLIVEYTVICDATAKSYPRHGLDFKRHTDIVTSNGDDYADNVWDKGHMAPANTFSCKESWLKETFLYVNCALQHQNLNRGAWAALEGFERDLAAIYDDVEVRIEVFFSDEWTTNSDPARIPSSFVKSLTWIEDGGKEKTLSFDFPNKNTKGKSFWSFKIE